MSLAFAGVAQKVILIESTALRLLAFQPSASRYLALNIIGEF